ncbi:MAG: hypothetical protein SO133_03665 [Alloprevotella sp.]|nr:hypothetical protein [Alloprevotella sp.]
MKYQHFNLQETIGLSEPLKEGYVIYRLGDKKVSFKSLYVPGVGWCPITKELSEDFTNIPKGLALYCPIDAKDDDIKSWIGKSSSITLYGDVGWYSIPSIRFDIYNHYMCSTKEIYFQYNAIRDEVGCEHLPVIFPPNSTYDYFVIIHDVFLYASEEIVSHIENYGFEDIRVDLESQVLFLTPSDKKKDFEEYDRLQILLNGYKPEKVKYMGKKPYYFMETTLWKDKNNHHLISPNDVIEVKINTNVYDTKIEEQIEELVAFFKSMRFKKSKELSNYIVKHQLGYKYPDLCGYLELSNGYDTWEFEGAIAPNYYADICLRLGLDNENSKSTPQGFESYRERERN